MTFSIVDAARAELLGAAQWYESRRSGLGEEFLAAAELAFQECRERPFHCSRMEAYQGSRDVRRVSIRRFPYSVIFHLQETGLHVVAIAHSSRRPLYWAGRL